MSDHLRILRMPGVMQRTGLARSTIYLQVREGAFPRPFSLGSPSAVGWLESEVNEWIAQRAAARTASHDLAAA